MTAERLERDQRLLAALKRAEWSSYAGCEGYGFMGSGPPMHQHPRCPVCGGHEPEFNAAHSRCFRIEGENNHWHGGITVGHKPGCEHAALIADMEKAVAGGN